MVSWGLVTALLVVALLLGGVLGYFWGLRRIPAVLARLDESQISQLASRVVAKRESG